MLSNAFRLYVNENIAFVRSLIIKSAATAYLINKQLKLLNIDVDENDPTTWKYYLNLAGEYHATDEVMQVVSSDDQTTIDFTKANLVLHPLTRLDYDIGGRFYQSLVDKYPRQEYLIHCIANPVDINKAIAADNYTILYYNDKFLSPRETNVVKKLQTFIYNQEARWDVDNYISTDLYYAAAFLGVLVPQIPMALINIKLGNIGTKYVDDFHLWNYLADHYRLNRYRQQLNDKQALYLYRNIIDIRRNAGKEETIRELYDRLAKPGNLDVSKLELIQDNTFQLNNGRTKGQSIYIDFESDDYVYASDNVVTSPQVIASTKRRAQLNEAELLNDSLSLHKRANLTTHSNEPLGLYRADPNTDNGVTNADIQDIRINNWIYLASTGFYQAEVDIIIPGRSFLRMNVKDAAIFFVYAANRSNGIEIDQVPDLWVSKVFTMAPPNPLLVRALIDSSIEDQFIIDTLAKLPTFTVLNTLEEFNTKVLELANVGFDLDIDWWNSLSDIEQSNKRSVINALYKYGHYPLVGSTTDYDNWLANLGFNKYDLSKSDYLEIANEILVKAAGVSIDVGAFSPQQQAVVDILDMLTSYNVAFTVGSGGADSITIDDIRPLPVNPANGMTLGNFLNAGQRIDNYSVDKVSITMSGKLPIKDYNLEHEKKGTLTGDLDSGQTVDATGRATNTNTLYSPGNFITDVTVNHRVL